MRSYVQFGVRRRSRRLEGWLIGLCSSAVLLGCQDACAGLTTKVVSKWRDSGRTVSLDLRTVNRIGSKIDLEWRATSASGFTDSGEMQLDTRLRGCAEIEILIAKVRQTEL